VSRIENQVHQLVDGIANANAARLGVVQHKSKRPAEHGTETALAQEERVHVPWAFLQGIVVLAVDIQGVTQHV
jgi:hypothetical protein